MDLSRGYVILPKLEVSSSFIDAAVLMDKAVLTTFGKELETVNGGMYTGIRGPTQHRSQFLGAGLQNPSNRNTLMWHQDCADDLVTVMPGIWIAMWSNLHPTMLRRKSTGEQIILPVLHPVVVNNDLFDHRPPTLTEEDFQSRYFARAYFIRRNGL